MDISQANEAVDKTAGMPAAKLLNKVFIIGIILLVIVGTFMGKKLLDGIDAANARADRFEEKYEKAIQAQVDCYNSKTEEARKNTEWVQQHLISK